MQLKKASAHNFEAEKEQGLLMRRKHSNCSEMWEDRGMNL